MSDFYNKYPYTDFHELNLDWVIERVKKLTEDWLATQAEWNDTEEQWQQLYNYVHDYFDNLDVSQEINDKIDAMVSDGTFLNVIRSTVETQTTTATENWLAAHITQPTTPAIDTSLTIGGAAADAAVAGNMIRFGDNDIYNVLYNDITKKTLIADISRDFDSPAYDLTMSSTGVLQGTRNSTPTEHPVLLNPYVQRCSFTRGNLTTIIIAYNETLNKALELNLTNGIMIWYDFNSLTYGSVKTYTLDNTVSGGALVTCVYDGINIIITTTGGNSVVKIPAADIQGYNVRFGWEKAVSSPQYIASNIDFIIPVDYNDDIDQITSYNIPGIYDILFDYSAKYIDADLTRDFVSPAYNLTMISGVLRGTRNTSPTAAPILLNRYVKKCSFNRGNPSTIVIAYNDTLNKGLELDLTNGILLWYDFNSETYGAVKTYTLQNTVSGNHLVKCVYDGNNITITTDNDDPVITIPYEDLFGYTVRFGWEKGYNTSQFNASSIQFEKAFDYDGKLLNRMDGKTVYFIGDSITNLGDGANGWQKRIAADLHLTQVNYGVSGTCMTAASLSDPDAMCVRYANMAADADYVFCLAGINDFGTDKPLGTLDSTSILDFTGALKTFIEGVYNKYMASTNYQFKLYYACPYNVTGYFGSETNGLGLTQLDYVTRAKEVCAMYGVPFLNLYESSGFNKVNEPYLLYDNLHPGYTGNMLLGNVIGLFLSTH